MKNKNINIKKYLCVLSVICCLSAVSVYAQEESFDDVYLQKSVQENLTDGVTPEYLAAVEKYFYSLIDKCEFEEALKTINYLIETNKHIYGEYHPQTGFSYVGRARYYMHLALYKPAKQDFDKAFEIYQKNPDNWDIKGNSIGGLIQFYYATEMPYEALKYLQMMSTKEFNPSTTAQKYLEFGNAYAGIRNINKAIDYYNKYYNESLKSDDDINLAAFNYHMAMASIYEGKVNYPLFYEHILKAEEAFKKIDNPDKFDWQISVNMTKIRYYMDINDTNSAKELLDKTKEIIDEAGREYQRENINLAYVDYMQATHNTKQAEKYLKKVKEIYEPYTPDSVQFLRYVDKMTDIYNRSGHPEKSWELIQIALNKISQIEEYAPAVYARYLLQAFNFKMQQGNVEEAKEYLNKSFAIYTKILPETAFEYCDLYKIFGGLSDREGNYKEALNYYNKAIKINSNLQGSDHKDIADLYTVISSIYARTHDYQKAVEYMDKNIEIYKASYGENNIQVYNQLIDKYNLYKDIGENSQAEVLLNSINKDFENNIVEGQSANINIRLNITNGYNELANKNYKKALNYAKKALTYTKYKPDKIAVYELIYNIYTDSGNKVKAYKYKKLAHIEE